MIDEILEPLIDWLLEAGVPSPTTLRRQRQARLFAGGLVLMLVPVTSAWIPGSTAASFINLGCVLIAAWVLVFSLVDIFKEPLPDTKTSIAALYVAVFCIVAVGRSLLS
jgi:hypothetical protein